MTGPAQLSPSLSAPESGADAEEPARIESTDIVIEVLPTMLGGLLNGRRDSLVRGRIVAATTIETAAIFHAGVQVGLIHYGRYEPANATRPPQAARQHLFAFAVPRPMGAVGGAWEFEIAVHAAGQKSCRLSFAALWEAASGSSTLTSGPCWSVSESEIDPPVLLYVERAAVDPSGTLTLSGWALAFAPLITVQVFLGEERLGATKLGVVREDIAAQFPNYPKARLSGFTLTAELGQRAAEVSWVRTEAITLGGHAQESLIPVERVSAAAPAPPGARVPDPMPPLPAPLGASPDARRKIHYHCDHVELDTNGVLKIDGWAACAVGIASVAIELDGTQLGEAEFGRPRHDVGDEYPTIPMARHSGFRFESRLGSPTGGSHRVRIVIRNVLGDTREGVIEAAATEAEAAPSSPAAVPTPEEFRLEIDSPAIVDGVVAEPVAGRLSIEGWALSRAGVAGVAVLLDDQLLGEAHCGLVRQDVERAFPDWSGSLRSGFAFHCPSRALRNGIRVVRLRICAKGGGMLERSFRVEVQRAEGDDSFARLRRRMSCAEADIWLRRLGDADVRPVFRLILPYADPNELPLIDPTIRSLVHQVYPEWRLCLFATADATAQDLLSLLQKRYPDIANRLEVLPARGAFSQASRAHRAGRRLLYGVLRPGDELGCDALLNFGLDAAIHRHVDFFYADELQVNPATGESEPFLKPDFSPDLLRATNYIGRSWFADALLVRRAGVAPKDLNTVGEYGFVLACTEKARGIRHMPALVCRRAPGSGDGTATERLALERTLARDNVDGEVVPGLLPATWRIRREVSSLGRVSIIIPTCASGGHIETCIRSIREGTAYRNIEIVCIENIQNDNMHWRDWLRAHADRVIAASEAFNWSRFNNMAADAATGDYLLFLNDDVEVIHEDWLEAMLEYAQQPEIGVVGPLLLYPDRKVQHAGMFLAEPGKARHAFRFGDEDDPGYFGLARTPRNVIAVTGACMMVRRDVFGSLGGFDEIHSVINNDVDFCLKAHKASLRTVFTPHARLIHHEFASRDRIEEAFDLAAFNNAWKTIFAEGDPYFSPCLSRQHDDYRPEEEPTELIVAGHPVLRAADIERILIVKLDHIGDFLTAIPAIRRLREVFPRATLHLLGNPAIRAFVTFESGIDEFIPFEFFHARSGLGQRSVSGDDLDALRGQLAEYRFDLAIDLRKQPDTREMLRYTGAKILAGYDHMGRFPFLDIALEWEGDRNLQRKRAHISDDLLTLVEAVRAACAIERMKIDLPADACNEWRQFLPDDCLRLFDHPVVAIHPGVGNEMRQWPAEHFATLVDLLTEGDELRAVLIGGPDEVDLAEEVLAQVVNQRAVASTVGKVPLRALPGLLTACALYVGNNSGPKHIAAAFGVSTIGIHSGVVDAAEWAPVGRTAVAVRRNMACSPCYLARIADCPRGLACLRQLRPSDVHAVAQRLIARQTGVAAGETLASAVRFGPKFPPPG